MMSKANFNIKARTVFENQIGLVLYLALDEGEGNVAHDFSGKGNNGTIYGATWVNGKYGKALSFDGVNDYVRTVSISLSSVFTIVAWIKVLSGVSLPTVIANGASGLVSNGFKCWHNRTDRKIGWQDGDGSTGETVYSNGTLPFDSWGHFAVVVNRASSIKFYINGNFDVERTLTVNFNLTGSIDLGQMINGYSDSMYKGLIDEVRIYNRALTSFEILNLFLNSPKRSYLPSKLKVRGVS